MAGKGYVKFQREIFDWRLSPIKQRRPLTQFEAWIWILCQANHRRRVVGNTVVERGQFMTSFRKLAEVWGRDRKTVRRWVKNFSFFEEIALSYGPSHVLVTLCNYEEYQGNGTTHGTTNGATDGTTHGTTNGTQTRMKENDKRMKKKAPPPIERFNAFLQENQDKVYRIAKAIKRVDRIDYNDDVDRWLRNEIGKMRAWVEANTEGGRANKKDWGRFVGNWLNKAVDAKAPDFARPYANYMTPDEEAAYYRNKRRSGEGGMVAIGDLIGVSGGRDEKPLGE